MSQKPPMKAKLTDEERHKRFKNVAREVEASGDEKDFDKAISRLLGGSSQSSDR